MGWVSLLEDAITKFEDSMHLAMADRPSQPESVPVQEWRSIAGLLSRGEKILEEAANYLEMATDPAIDLAHELKCSINEASELKNRVSEFQKTCFSLMSALRDREGYIKELEKELKSVRIDRNQLEKKLNSAMKENPGSVYDQYLKGANAKQK